MVYKISDLKMGKEAADPYIRPGDIVILTEGEPVYVTGAVVAPQVLTLKDGMTLQRALAMTGGPTRQAKTSAIHIYRVKEGKLGPEDLTFNYDTIKKGQQPDVLLRAYDIVDVRLIGTFAPRNLADMVMGLGKSMATSLPMTMIY